jgi:hypothetical protein
MRYTPKQNKVCAYFLGWQTTPDGLPKSLVKFKNPWTQLSKIDITMPKSKGPSMGRCSDACHIVKW